MELPKLEAPEKYTGLYIFDFGEQVAVGYTAREIAVLLESDQYRNGKAYRIHRAAPDGTMEIKGVARERFAAEDGLFFYRESEGAAREDFDDLAALAGETPPPCRMKAVLAKIDGDPAQYVAAIIFPAEFTDDVADWLNEADYAGGDIAEGGISQVTQFNGPDVRTFETRQFWPAADDDSRSAEEVLANTDRAIQRIPA